MKVYLICLLLAPLMGALVNAFRWSNEKIKPAACVGVTSCLISFFVSVYVFFLLVSAPENSVTVVLFNWLIVDSFHASFSFLLDSLSVLMLLVITGVGSLIHIFSIYYMSEDKRPAKYFSYLNLFIFSMMILVLAEDLFLMFIGWEAVGLCSYLLIGFWFTDRQKAAAGMKAFIFNRIGDMGFLIGLFLLLISFHSLNVTYLKEIVSDFPEELNSIKWACLFLFLGATGKSAQIPLYLWLPSAMAGPTPVSALIHAATMVTAGVFLIVRLDFLFVMAPLVLTLISYVGALTAFVAAVIACLQSDIKKVLAYSTVSQLGYMFVAVGLKAFVPAIFHLVTHAFFKALLFLSAGSIIHALHGEQNIHRMGGLRKILPWTWFSFLFGFLALIGIPPFSGFFSKDEILWQSITQSSFLIFAIAFGTALLTVFYMTRVFVLTFYGKPRVESHNRVTEGSFCALFPLIVLAFLSLTGGVLGVPHVMGEILPVHLPHFLENYLKPVLNLQNDSMVHHTWVSEVVFMIVSTLCMALMGFCTFWIYLKKQKVLLDFKNKNWRIFDFINQAFFLDSFCYRRIVQPVLRFSHGLKEEVDLKLIQGGIVLLQKWLLILRELFENLQNRKIQNYATYMILGLIIFIVSVLKG